MTVALLFKLGQPVDQCQGNWPTFSMKTSEGPFADTSRGDLRALRFRRSPNGCLWLNSEEKDWPTSTPKFEVAATENVNRVGPRQTLMNGQVWALSLVHFGFI